MNPDVRLTEKAQKKTRKRIIRATWFDKEEFEKLLRLFQEYYPKNFPKKKVANSVPALKIKKIIKKDSKIKITDLMLSRFLHQYITKQQNKSLPQKQYYEILRLLQKDHSKFFPADYSVIPTHSILNKIKRGKNTKISPLMMSRFFNQYLKKQKSFLQKQEKKYTFILIKLQNIYPDAFSKEEKKLLKLGIFEDIKKDGKLHITDNDLKSFLNHYTKQEDYLNCYFDTPVRHDLHGNIVAPTTKQERFFAKKLLKKLQKK